MTVRLSGTPALETGRLTLRAPGPQDWDACAAFLCSDRARHLGGPHTRPDAWRSFGHLVGHWVLRGYGMFVFCLKGSDAALGAVGPLYPEGWAEPEIGWSVWSKAHEGKGYVAEAAAAARDHAFVGLGWTTAVSYIDADNTRSIALAERLGCRYDADAALPALPNWEGTLVYRHPAPGDT
ncbi:GNAT family N-acetyltransferase [Roseovarius sp. SYSU LYC5161]|uniref:GNAT family N-acetyltransferase n=1 Tax=Roseovarius halophilus (ex Wu et al. 2025) TaxID=3376060 RepID=UPI00399C1D78